MGWLQAACHTLSLGHHALQQLLVMLKEARCLQRGSDGMVWCYSGLYCLSLNMLSSSPSCRLFSGMWSS